MENRKDLNGGTEQYQKPEMEIVEIKKSEVIMTSCPTHCCGNGAWQDDGSIQLPIGP